MRRRPLRLSRADELAPLRGIARLGCRRALAVLHHAELLEPHPPHRLPQRRRPARAVHRHHLSVAIPRRPDRRARPEPAGAGRDHRRRDRRLGDRRNRFLDHHRSRQAARICIRAKATARPKTRSTASISRSIRSASRRCCGGWFRRPRRARASTIAMACCWSTAAICSAAATCCASICRRRTRKSPACSSAPSSRCGRWLGRGDLPLYHELGADERQGLSRSGAGLERPECQHGAHQRSRRCHRLGRGAGAALPRRARRAHAVDAGRRHRRHGRGRTARHLKVFLVAAARDGRAVDPARRHHRRAGAAACRRCRKRAPPHPLARRNPRFHPPPRRDRALVRHAARHDQRALQPDRGDRKLRRRRGARTEESAHLAALGGGDAAGGEDRGEPRRGCSPSSSTTCSGSIG